MKNHTGLKLITNEKFNKVMNTTCTVNMDNEVIKSNDFVTVAHDTETGTTAIYSNADALTLGQAMVLTQQAFKNSMEQLSAKEREAVLAAL